MPNQCCGNCKYGKFEMTRHNPPRPVKRKIGYCMFDTAPNLAEAKTHFPTCVKLDFSNFYIGPSDGCKCPVWERRA